MICDGMLSLDRVDFQGESLIGRGSAGPQMLFCADRGSTMARSHPSQ